MRQISEAETRKDLIVKEQKGLRYNSTNPFARRSIYSRRCCSGRFEGSFDYAVQLCKEGNTMAVYTANNPVKTLSIHKPGCRRIPKEGLRPCGCGKAVSAAIKNGSAKSTLP